MRKVETIFWALELGNSTIKFLYMAELLEHLSCILTGREAIPRIGSNHTGLARKALMGFGIAWQ